MTLPILFKWGDNKTIFKYVSDTHYGCMVISISHKTGQLMGKSQPYLSDSFAALFSQDKISGICHLSCSYQAKEADSVKEKTYCSFHFIWPVKTICITPENSNVSAEWLSITDSHKQHFLLVTLWRLSLQIWNERNPIIPQIYQRLSYIEEHTFEMLLERLTECPKAFSFWKRKNKFIARVNQLWEYFKAAIINQVWRTC